MWRSVPEWLGPGRSYLGGPVGSPLIRGRLPAEATTPEMGAIKQAEMVQMAKVFFIACPLHFDDDGWTRYKITKDARSHRR